ncbi:TPA: hypothetical protein NJ323_001122 [Vibrio parahaemolyticus]|nr:hypothetical protein [Vibrio parahaemolyticus]HCG7154738.1 hypothetical protein [Vibrio parahaemolyticus]HCH1562985.1 hypothetical protein [Vibrio parahaemolyticus]
MRILLYVLFSLSVSIYSLYLDWGSDSFTWFQRSGALIVLAGAILSYRSIFRLGINGVGGASDNGVSIGKVAGYSEDGKMLIQHSEEHIRYYEQILLDKFCGYIGAILAILGTVVCGYGDLLGRI